MPMDNFTLTVLIADAFVIIAIVALMLLDKGSPAPVVMPPEPPKPVGKRSGR